jgi:hypothetical protein
VFDLVLRLLEVEVECDGVIHVVGTAKHGRIVSRRSERGCHGQRRYVVVYNIARGSGGMLWKIVPWVA